MITNILKYLTVVCLLIGIMECNRIPVISVLGKYSKTCEQTDNGCTEDPVKESENLRVESVKDYLHEFTTFQFNEPVFVVAVNPVAIHREDFPYHFYPDVLTPPPNC